MGKVLAFWLATVSAAGVFAAGPVVWWAPSDEFVSPRKGPPSAVRASDREIAIELAKGEAESFQIAVRGTGTNAVKGVTLEVSTAGFPGKAKWWRVAYFQRGPKWEQDGPKALPDDETEIGEPLLPAAKFEVAPGRTQGLWVTVTADREAKAGDYAATLFVRQGETSLAEFKLKLTVFDFALPKTFSFPSAISYTRDPCFKAYGPDRGMKECLRIEELMLEHRLNPVRIYDSKEMDSVERLKHFESRGMNRFCAMSIDGVKQFQSDSNRVEKIVAELRRRAKVLREAGLLDKAFIYGFDEESSKHKDFINDICRRLHAGCADLPLMTTTACIYRGIGRGEDLGSEIICPGFGAVSDKMYLNARRLGRECWCYSCNFPGAPYINIAALSHAQIERRLLSWAVYAAGADGYLFWKVNNWHWNKFRKIDEKSTAIPWWKTVVRDRPGRQPPGDGLFTYPGQNGVLSSIRLELLRDASEDYDYFKLAESKHGREAVLAEVRKVVRSFKDYDVDGEKLREVRRALANMIR